MAVIRSASLMRLARPAPADLHPGCEHEGVGDASAGDQPIDFSESAASTVRLIGLGAADSGDQRTPGVERLRAPHFLAAMSGRRATGAYFATPRRGLGAVGGTESVVDVDVAHGGHLLRQDCIVFFFALVEPAVFEKHGLAGLDRNPLEPVALERHFHTEEPRKVLRNRGERLLFVELTLGRPAQVGRQQQARAPG
jgi:hypothetical protein